MLASGEMGSTVRVRGFSDEFIRILDSYLKRDPVTNFYPLYDLYDEESRRKTEWYVGLKGDRITGFLLIYRGLTFPSIITDGDLDTVSSLLDMVDESKAVFHVDPELSDIVKNKFPIGSEYATEIMSVRKGEERLYIGHDVKSLNEDHAMEMLKLMHEWRPTLGDITDEEVMRTRNELRSECFYGIFTDRGLASVVQLELLFHIPEVCWIGRVFTSQRYRGRGFATSLVSKAVEDAFKHDSVKYVGLNVRSDNVPAKHVYEKVGFKKHRDRRWLNLNVEITP